MAVSRLAQLDRVVRPLLVRTLPPRAATKLYSKSRVQFTESLLKEDFEPFVPPSEFGVTCWGQTFQLPIFNAAGMFKNGFGYEQCANEGAGAFLAGTTTAVPRVGNTKDGVTLPFAPYPESRSSSNWLGLPNEGDEIIAKRLAGIQRKNGAPVGVSVSGSPELDERQRLYKLVDGLKRYRDAGVSYIEINESCPNTEVGEPRLQGLEDRLSFVATHFLSESTGASPAVVLKFSCDTELAAVPELIRVLTGLGFHGVNFGNTSTAYASHAPKIAPRERRLYDYFVGTFGGGVGGAVLKELSLALIRAAASYLQENPPPYEFHLIRTGGIESAQDVFDSLEAGASLVQWFTGYFETFGRHRHALYRELCKDLKVILQQKGFSGFANGHS